MRMKTSFALFALAAVLVYAPQARAFYDARQGRFLSRDPIQEKGGLNLYAFVENAPANHVDVLGHGKLDFLYPGKCCNSGPETEYYLKDGQWHPLAPGTCTGQFTDCDGMTCSGKFYYVGGFETGGCDQGCVQSPRNWNEYCKKPCWKDRAWSPTGAGGNAMPPGRCDPSAPPGRGAMDCKPPPGYTWR